MICAFVNVLLFATLVHNSVPIAWSVVIAFVAAATLNYFLCISILFQHKARWDTFGEIVAYLATLVCMGLLDLGLTVSLTAVGIAAVLSKAISVVIGFAGNFLLRRFLVFPKRRAVRV